MLKTYQFKTHCKGDSHSSKTANIILPGRDDQCSNQDCFKTRIMTKALISRTRL